MLALLVPLAGWVACGGKVSLTGGGAGGTAGPGTTSGIYIATITGTSGANTATGKVSITVK
jgi:hypothetical protein